jgi:unsaturated pyranuronate lyase
MIQYRAMTLYNWNQITEEPLNPMATRQMIHGASITIARLRTRKGSIVPTHSHVNEQITTMEKGSMLFVTPTEKIVVRAGESLVIPPNVPHSVESLEDCVAVDIFSPVREDWVRGDDAYLRG